MIGFATHTDNDNWRCMRGPDRKASILALRLPSSSLRSATSPASISSTFSVLRASPLWPVQCSLANSASARLSSPWIERSKKSAATQGYSCTQRFNAGTCSLFCSGAKKSTSGFVHHLGMILATPAAMVDRVLLAADVTSEHRFQGGAMLRQQVFITLMITSTTTRKQLIHARNIIG